MIPSYLGFKREHDFDRGWSLCSNSYLQLDLSWLYGGEKCSNILWGSLYYRTLRVYNLNVLERMVLDGVAPHLQSGITNNVSSYVYV